MHPLVVIELSVRNQTAGIVQHGKQKGLHSPAAGTRDIRTKQHVGLPDLIAELGFKLFASGRGQQLPRGQSALSEKTIQGGRANGSRSRTRAKSEFPQQGGSGPMRVLAFQALD